jgi:hypothetical protein
LCDLGFRSRALGSIDWEAGLRAVNPPERRTRVEARHLFLEGFPLIGSSNERTSGNGAVALWFHIARLSRAVPECERLPVKTTEEQHRRTLRMSLALSASGRWSTAHLCTGRRAYSACDGRHHAPRPLVAVQYGSRGRLRLSGKPGAWSRPDLGLLCYHNLRRPAAHPQR